MSDNFKSRVDAIRREMITDMVTENGEDWVRKWAACPTHVKILNDAAERQARSEPTRDLAIENFRRKVRITHGKVKMSRAERRAKRAERKAAETAASLQGGVL